MNGVKMAGGIVAVVALLALVLATSFRSEPGPEPTVLQPESDQGAVEPQFDIRMKGDIDAPITIFELSDFQCPWCRQFTLQTLPALEAEYIVTGKARLVFVNLPIPSLHPNAPAAHEFAMCAASQERFWPVHDMLFERQAEWQDLSEPGPWFLQQANSLGLERGPLDACLEQGSMRPLIMADLNTAQRGGVNSTPTFVIEGGLLKGAASIEDLRPILDSIYVAKTGSEN